MRSLQKIYSRIPHARRIKIIYDSVVHKKRYTQIVEDENLSYNTIRNIIVSYMDSGRTNKKSYIRSTNAATALHKRANKLKQRKAALYRRQHRKSLQEAKRPNEVSGDKAVETQTPGAPGQLAAQSMDQNLRSHPSAVGCLPNLEHALLPTSARPLCSRPTTSPAFLRPAETNYHQFDVALFFESSSQEALLSLNLAHEPYPPRQDEPITQPLPGTQFSSMQQRHPTSSGEKAGGDRIRLQRPVENGRASDTELISSNILTYESEKECIFNIFTGPLAALNQVAVSGKPSLIEAQPRLRERIEQVLMPIRR